MTALYADEESLEALSDDVGGLWCRHVAVLDSPPDSLAFLRDFAHPNVPCIIKNAIPSHANGTAGPLTLNLDEIVCHVGEDAKLTVDVTPDGHGDCIRSVLEANDEKLDRKQRRMFVKPHEKQMGIGKFRDLLRSRHRVCDHEQRTYHKKTTKNSAKTDLDGLEVLRLHHHPNDVGKDHSDTRFDEETQPPVVYYSRQNDCLRTEVAKLFSTRIFPETFPFAEQAFGTGPPDAINLWIGNENSVSSMHKDHYENLFYVCSGQKEFVLCPPADVVFLHEGEFSSGTFCPISQKQPEGESADESENACWVVVADESIGDNETTTKWIEPDIKKCKENGVKESRFPLLSKAHPIKVLVSEGEMLYIPSLWYHRVTQTCETVGVNYWFDMKFDSPHWCYFNFLQNLKKIERSKLNT